MTERVVIELDINDASQLLALSADWAVQAFWPSEHDLFLRLNRVIREGMEQREESA